MKKNLLFPFFLFLIAYITSSFIYHFQTNSEIIPWSSSRKLTWDDFQGSIDTTSHYKALTFSTVEIKSISQEKNQIKYQITNSFEVNLSWSKDKSSHNLLNHEQLHFDITELVTRKMKKHILSQSYRSIDDIKKNVREAFNEEEKERSKINALYDKETDHGINRSKQQQWENKIQAEIKALNKYSEKEIIVFIK